MSEITSEMLAKWKQCVAKASCFDGDWPYRARMLIAEVERLRSKCDELTINGFSAQLKQLDELRKENAGYSGSGQRIQDLSDEVGLLEDTNKKLAAEVERLRGEVVEIAASRDEHVGHAILANAEVEEVERLRSELDAVDQALGSTPTIVWANTTRADSIRELGREVERLRALQGQKS